MPLLPATGIVDLWPISCDGLTHPDGLIATVLSDDERDRAASLYFERDRRRWLTGRVHLRRVLAAYLECAPASVRLRYEPGGKPVIAGGPSRLHFNVSHSAGFMAIAVADAAIGVDLEPLRVVAEGRDIVRRMFSHAECAALDRVPPDEFDAAFVRCWTRKEAYVKATGLGLSASLGAFTVPIDRQCDGSAVIADGPDAGPGGWAVTSFDIGDRLVGAVASQGRPIGLRWRDRMAI